jgi:hypothetical protein
MTLADNYNPIRYSGNGLTTNFPFTFTVFDEAHLHIFVQNISTKVMTLLTPGTYTVSGLPDNGNINYEPLGFPLASGFDLFITRLVPYTQDLEITNQSGFFPITLMNQLDLLEMQIQQLKVDATRAHKAPLGEEGGVFSAADIGNAQLYALQASAYLAQTLALYNLAAGFLANFNQDAQDARYLTGAPAFLRKRKTLLGIGAAEGSAADQAAALTAGMAALSPGDYLDGQNGVYRLDTAAQVPSGLIMENVSFDISNAAANVYPLSCLGSLGAGTAVATALSKSVETVTVGSTANWARGTRLLFKQQCGWQASVAAINPGVSLTLTVPDTTRFAPGQIASINAVVGTIASITNPTTLVFNTTQTAGFAVGPALFILTRNDGFAVDQLFNGWWGTVRDVVSPTQIRLEKFYPSAFTIPAADCMAYAPDLRRGNRFHNVSAFRSGIDLDNTYFFRGELCDDLRWEGGSISNVQYAARVWYDCANFRVSNAVVEHAAQNGAGYGDGIVQTSEDWIVDGNKYRDVRHGVTVGGTGGIVSMGLAKDNSGHGCRQAFMDAHPNCRDIVFENNFAEMANRFRAAGGNNEGYVSQGANITFRNNKLRGLGSLTAGAGARDATGFLIQPFTRMPEDFQVLDGNDLRDTLGTGILGMFVSNRKISGNLDGLRIESNTLRMTDAGSNGNTSPAGLYVEAGAFGTNISNMIVADNNVWTRATALTVALTSPKTILNSAISGNAFNSENTDAPVIDILDGGVASLADRIAVTGNVCEGGNYSYRRAALVGRDFVDGNVFRNFATAAINGAPFLTGTNLIA